MASEVGVRELKNGLSDWLERVEAGEVLTVTRRGKPVARVLPVDIPPHLARLVAEGRLEWTGRKPDFGPRVKLSGEGKTAVEYVIEGRR